MSGATGDTAGGVLATVVRAPASALRPYVAGYRGYRMAGFPPGLHAGLPSRFLTLVVSLGDPVDVAAMPDPRQRPDRYASLLGGLHAAPAWIRHDGNQHGIQVDLHPSAARALLRVSAAELASTVVSLPDVLGGLGVELVDRLATLSGWEERFALLDDVLLRALRRADASPQPVGLAWEQLCASEGRSRIDALAREAGWSRRQYTERFRAEFGLPPKVVARVLRFERARSLLMRSDAPTLAAAAATCGFADQAHMTREWKALAGSSPLAWLDGEALPFVQDGRDDGRSR